jgi:hypothetical protein
LPITEVEFFQGTTKFGESTSEPYSAQLGGLAPGEYQILARATNSAGLTRDSEPITVFVSASTLPSGGIPFVDKYSQSFDALPREVKAATLPWSEGITLPGWYGATLSSGNWTASTAFQGDDGGSNVQVLKSLGKSWGRNRSLGTLSVNLTTWGLCLLNAGSTSISKVTISFTGEQWRVSSNPANNKDLFLQMSTTATGVGTSSGFTQIPELTFVPPTKTSATTTKLDGKLPANRVALQQTVPIPGGWQPGAPLWIRWTTGTGQSSIVAIENLTIQAGGVSPASPELAIEPAGLRILWEGAAGNTYRLETSTDLSPGSWAPLDPPIQLVGNGALTGNFLYETAGETKRFFRVRLEP